MFQVNHEQVGARVPDQDDQGRKIAVPSVFNKYLHVAYPYEYRGQIRTTTPLVGGTPSDPNVAERWIRAKFTDNDELVRQMVASAMAETGRTLTVPVAGGEGGEDGTAEGEGEDDISSIDLDAATQLVRDKISLNAFKRNPPEGTPTHDSGHPVGELFIEGRQLKAGIKEAGSICVAAGKLKARGWGKTNKGIKSFLAEHFCVPEDRLYLGTDTPTGTQQRFVHTYQGSGIQYEEYLVDAVLDFTVRTDYDFSEKEWAILWLTAEQQGIGSTRSQGFGRYEVTEWSLVRG